MVESEGIKRDQVQYNYNGQRLQEYLDYATINALTVL